MIVTIIIVSQTELHKPGNKMQTMQSSRIKLTNISSKVTTFLKCNKVTTTEANVVMVWIQARPTLKKKKIGPSCERSDRHFIKCQKLNAHYVEVSHVKMDKQVTILEKLTAFFFVVRASHQHLISGSHTNTLKQNVCVCVCVGNIWVCQGCGRQLPPHLYC